MNAAVNALVRSAHESVECPACGSAGRPEEIAVPDHEYALSYVAHYVECSSCGTLVQQPMPSSSQLSEFYPPDYHSMVHEGRIARLRNDIRIKKLLKLKGINGPILDYGCGDGSFLLHAAETYPQETFWGYEIGARSETKILAGGRVTIIRGEPDNLLRQLPLCGMITMNHVIEHLPDPQSIVQRLTDRLLPGGVFEGQTPAADSLERAVFGTRWSGYHAPRHTVIFSRAGLRQLLEAAGLQSVSTKGAFNPAALAVSVGSVAHSGPGRVRRQGIRWLSLLAIAGILAPIDLCSGRPGVMDYIGYKPA